MEILENYMSVIAIMGSLVFYVQGYKVFRNKSAADLSLPAFLIGLFTSVNWFCYGLIIKDTPLMVSGGFGAVGATLVIIEILYYKRQ